MSDPEPPFLTTLAHHAADPFRLLVESVVEYAIFMLDPAGRVASWNPGAERIYGYSDAEAIGRHFRDFQETGSHLAADMAIATAQERGAHISEGTRVRKGGSTFDAEVTVSDLKDYFGNHAGFSVVTRDITERKRAAEAVEQERDLSRAILESLPGVYYMYDMSGRFLRWNRRFEEVTEYTSDEIAGLHPLDLFAGAEKDLLERKIASVFENGWDEVEADFVAKSGKKTPYYFNGARTTFEGKTCLIGMGIDISNQQRALAELRATDERLRLAAKAANVGLWDWDIKADTWFYSSEWKRQLGFDEDEVGPGFDEWQDRLHPDDREGANARLEAFLKDPSKGYVSEFRLRHKDGTYRNILSQASIVLDAEGNPARMMGSHVDVTDQRRSERRIQMSQKMEAIGQLAAGIAHDFNNLLTVINGYSGLLLDQTDTDDTTSDALREIARAGARAQEMTRQLLAFSRQQVLEPQTLELNQVVDEIAQLLRRLIGADVSLETSFAAESVMIRADRSQLEQVLVNLAVNARDAMPGGGTLTLETELVTLDEGYVGGIAGLAPGEYVLLAVSDTGVGMDEETHARIFEPFFTTKEPGQGTGLGLATVHGIVKQSGGHVAVYSEPGSGTTFKVYLPALREPAAVKTSQLTPPAMPMGSETVLLVEDEESVRALTRAVLQRCGYVVIEAADGEEALALASNDTTPPIDLLVTDVVMPRLGGPELAERFRSLRPNARVLYVSGYTADAVLHHGVLVGAGFLQKPFSAAMFAQKVRSVLDGAA